jgi:hypothetical protein
MRFVKGYLGCWLGFALPLFLFAEIQNISGFHPAQFLAFTAAMALLPTLVTALFERNDWHFGWYLLPSAIVNGVAVGMLMSPLVLMLGSHEGNKLVYLAAIAGAGAFVGAIMGGGYRLLAGAKAQ